LRMHLSRLAGAQRSPSEVPTAVTFNPRMGRKVIFNRQGKIIDSSTFHLRPGSHPVVVAERDRTAVETFVAYDRVEAISKGLAVVFWTITPTVAWRVVRPE